MKLTGRTTLTILILGLCLLLGILLRGAIQEYLVSPLSLVLWLLWRYFQSIDQNLCWGFLVLAILIYAFYRVVHRPYIVEEAAPVGQNATLENMAYWRTMIQITSDEIDRPNTLKTELGKLLASFYTVRQPGSEYAEIYQALRNGLIPLPGSIQNFLFPPQPGTSHRSIRLILKAIGQAPQRWFLHWTGRDRQEYFRSIEEVLTFMDSLMETPNDNSKLPAPQH